MTCRDNIGSGRFSARGGYNVQDYKEKRAAQLERAKKLRYCLFINHVFFLLSSERFVFWKLGRSECFNRKRKKMKLYKMQLKKSNSHNKILHQSPCPSNFLVQPHTSNQTRNLRLLFPGIVQSLILNRASLLIGFGLISSCLVYVFRNLVYCYAFCSQS